MLGNSLKFLLISVVSWRDSCKSSLKCDANTLGIQLWVKNLKTYQRTLVIERIEYSWSTLITIKSKRRKVIKLILVCVSLRKIQPHNILPCNKPPILRSRRTNCQETAYFSKLKWNYFIFIAMNDQKQNRNIQDTTETHAHKTFFKWYG